MVSYNNMWRGCIPLWIAVEALLIFLALGGRAHFRTTAGGRWQYSREISSSPGAARAVDDGGVRGKGSKRMDMMQGNSRDVMVWGRESKGGVDLEDFCGNHAGAKLW